MAEPGRAFPVDFRALRGTRRRNQFAALPRAFESAAVPHLDSPEVPVSAARLRDAFLEALEGEPRLTRVRASEQPLQVEFVQRSRVLRLPDVVTVGFERLDEHCSAVAIWSRARYGAYDFGVNHRRVRRGLARLRDRMAREVPQS